MASTIETGHAKNVAIFQQLTLYITGFGTAYNPSNPALSLAALQQLLAQAEAAVEQVNAAIPAHKNAISAREAAFKPLNPLITRVINALYASEVSTPIKQNARTLVRKLQGKRAPVKSTTHEPQEENTEAKEPCTISSAQLSYTNRLNTFDQLIKLLASLPEYAPNEPELTTAALTELYNQLQALNAAVVNTFVPLSNARIARNRVLYNPETGLLATGNRCKTYCKSVFGATGAQYQQIRSLKFKAKKE